jgi:hypothetical protein
VDTLKEAETLMTTFKFDLVLALEHLSDGRGCDLAEQVARESNSLLVGIELSETYLWLPVIYHGNKVMGERAINSEMVEMELEELLAAGERAHINATLLEAEANNATGRPGRRSRPRRRDVGLVTDNVPSAVSVPDPYLQAKRALLRARLSPARAVARPPDWMDW